MPAGHADCQPLFKQGLFPVVQLIKSSLHLFCLYAVPEDVGVVPSIIKSNIFARFLAVLICHIEWLLIADTSNNSQIFFRKGKVTVILFGKLADRILGVMVQPSH